MIFHISPLLSMGPFLWVWHPISTAALVQCPPIAGNVLIELKTKHDHLEKMVNEFQCTTPSSYVQYALLKTALHLCATVISDGAILFSSLYNIFLSYLPAKEFIDIADVCISKSRLLTFVGNEFGMLLDSFCSNKKIGTVFHRNKADLRCMLTQTLHEKSKLSARLTSSSTVDTKSLNRSVHTMVEHILHKSHETDSSAKLALDVDKFIGDVQYRPQATSK